jgi:hypothetical protein
MAYATVIKVIAEILGRSPKAIMEAIKVLGINYKKIPFKELLSLLKQWYGYAKW